MNKKILCLDFDGVIHSYTSDWKGATIIPDPAVPGALEFIVKALAVFEVAIFSSRSNAIDGTRWMKLWLKGQFMLAAQDNPEQSPAWLVSYVTQHFPNKTWINGLSSAIDQIVEMDIQWYTRKPPATVTLDDRAIQFQGEWPSLNMLENFKPWNKQ